MTCGSDGSYVVVACTAISTHCDSNEPDVSGSNMEEMTTNSCDGTGTGGTCSHSCSTGYEGGSVTCGVDSQYTVVPCTVLAQDSEEDGSDVGADDIDLVTKSSRAEWSAAASRIMLLLDLAFASAWLVAMFVW